jgi:hypothetical protein
VGLAWIPKATVQAALGAAALEQALEENAGPECVFSESLLPCFVYSFLARRSLCWLSGLLRVRSMHEYERRQRGAHRRG